MSLLNELLLPIFQDFKVFGLYLILNFSKHPQIYHSLQVKSGTHTPVNVHHKSIYKQ